MNAETKETKAAAEKVLVYHSFLRPTDDKSTFELHNATAFVEKPNGDIELRILPMPEDASLEDVDGYIKMLQNAREDFEQMLKAKGKI